MTKLEVRCCQPTKLLGWLQVAEHDVALGKTVRFYRHDPGLTLYGQAWPQVYPIKLRVRSLRTTDRLTGEHISILALSSEETPLEELLELPGFEVAP